jgi:hypothetical protein
MHSAFVLSKIAKLHVLPAERGYTKNFLLEPSLIPMKAGLSVIALSTAKPESFWFQNGLHTHAHRDS